MKQAILMLACVGLLFACTPTTEKTQTKVYYDLEGFVKKQIDLLAKENPLVQKSATIKAQTQQKNARGINWAHELELFVQADINKPAFRSSYQIVRPDSLTYQYTVKPEEERLTVQSLTIRLDSITRQPRHIDVLLRTKNPLYDSDRRLSMNCELSKQNVWRVIDYQIDGFQQLRFFDRNDFAIKAEIQ